MLAMVVYPEVQQLAQEELDRVVGREASPNFADHYGKLPYIQAMVSCQISSKSSLSRKPTLLTIKLVQVKESLRWRPVDPIGLPHQSSEVRRNIESIVYRFSNPFT